MKPDILLHMMEEISPEYIEEAKPKYTRVRPMKKTTSAHIPAGETAPARPAMQKRRKDNTMKGSVIQRLTTGMVAAAALAVFVGGGVFIAKQQSAKSKADSPAAQIAEQKAVNFLGGTGAVKPDFVGGRFMPILHDNDNLYLPHMTIPRSGALLTEIRESDLIDSILCDGERFYERDGAKLSIVAQDGTRTPFLDVSAFDADLDFPVTSYFIFAVHHICDDIYYIEYFADGANEAGEILEAARSFVYHADTGEAEQFGDAAFNTVQPDGSSGFYGIAEEKHFTHYTVTPELSSRQYSLTDGQRNYNAETLRAYAISPDQRFAYLLVYPQDDVENLSYLRLNLESGDVTVLFEAAPFLYFAESDGKLYSLTPNKNELVSSDLDFSTHTVLWHPDDDTPQDFREQLIPDNLGCRVLAANSEYVILTFGANKFGVFDLNTKTMRYVREVDAEAEPVQQTDEQQQTEPQQITEINGKRILTDGEQRYLTEQNQIWLLDDDGNEIPFFTIHGVYDYRYCRNGYERSRDLVPENTTLTLFRHVWGDETTHQGNKEDMYVYQGYEYDPETDEYTYFTGYTGIEWFDSEEKYLAVTVYDLPAYLAQYPLTINRISEEEQGFYFELDGQTYFTHCISDTGTDDSAEEQTYLINPDGSKTALNPYGDAPLDQTQERAAE